MKARAQTSKAALQAAQSSLSHTRIKAPFDGTIQEVLVEQGESVMPGQPLLIIDHQNTKQVRAYLPISIADNLQLGSTVKIQSSNNELNEWATVTELARVADTHSRTVEVILELPKEAPFKPGSAVKVLAPNGVREGIWIPSDAIKRKGQLTYVFIVDQNLPRMRLIKSGRQMDASHLTEILTGLNEGDIVLKNPPSQFNGTASHKNAADGKEKTEPNGMISE